VTTLTTVEVLRGAKAVLERNGWHQGSLYDITQLATGTPRNECRVCLVGAFCVAASGDPVGRNIQTDAAWDAVVHALDERGLLFADSPIADWNDEPGRTVGEVFELLDEAIALAENTNNTTGGTK